jgi:hypothetical protein
MRLVTRLLSHCHQSRGIRYVTRVWRIWTLTACIIIEIGVLDCLFPFVRSGGQPRPGGGRQPRMARSMHGCAFCEPTTTFHRTRGALNVVRTSTTSPSESSPSICQQHRQHDRLSLPQRPLREMACLVYVCSSPHTAHADRGICRRSGPSCRASPSSSQYSLS